MHRTSPRTHYTLRKYIFLLSAISFAALAAQPPAAPLPPNYRTIFDNPDLLVMRVHYGPHEFVPMHDHSAYPTVYVYLNDSGEIEISHEGPNAFAVRRPPTHTGAFRIAPGMAERHSVKNLSDIPSDFLRVELKRIPPTDLKHVFRGEVPTQPVFGPHTEFHDDALQVDRILCRPDAPCTSPPSAARSVLVAISPFRVQTALGNRPLPPGDVLWIPPSGEPLRLSAGAEALRISLLYPE